MLAATSILFFTRVRGFTPTSVSHAMALAGVLALIAGIPLGRLADRLPVERMLTLLTGLEGAAVLSYALTDSFLAFAVAVCAAVTANRCAPGLRNTYIARGEPGPDRVQLRALLRSATNAGLAIGSGTAALILAVNDSTGSFLVILALDTLSFVAVALLYARLPTQTPITRKTHQIRDVLRDRPFVLATVSESLLSLHGALLLVAVPLWVATQTTLPHAVSPALFATSAAVCVVAQVPVARRIATPRVAGKAGVRAGYLLATSCLIYAFAHGKGDTALLVAVLLAATLARAAGEVMQNASAWGLSFALAPLPSFGLYQSVFSTGYTGAIIIAPLAWTLVATRHDSLGWIAMAIVFIGSGHLAGVAGRTSARGGDRRVERPDRMQQRPGAV